MELCVHDKEKRLKHLSSNRFKHNEKLIVVSVNK